MAVDIFLKIDGIKGESRDDKHQDQIEIQSYSWGASQSASFATGGAGAGKIQFQDIHCTKKVDRSSPVLFLRCATGEHIKEATLYVRRAGESLQEFLQVKLNDIMVSSYQNGGSSGGDLPTDQISLNFAKIEYAYTLFDATGKESETIRAGWDLRTNAAT